MGNIENVNEVRDLAWELVENTGETVFLTGNAGTGKTTFLRDLVARSKKRLVVLAPTGIAAINAGGVTIHSFFQLPFNPFIPGSDPFGGERRMKFSKMKLQLIRSLDLIVIDEVSMVRADLLDAIDAVLRRIRRDARPFGGVQLLMIGDLMQLPPVTKDNEDSMLAPYYRSSYFFDSRALSSMRYHIVELKKIYRQNDQRFISLLNAIRENRVNQEVLGALNARYIPDFEAPVSPRYIRLTTHNELARRINERELARLPGTLWSHSAEVKGVFPESSFPADSCLQLKKGAQVLFIRNDISGERRFYNGMLGEVVALDKEKVYVRPEGLADTLAISAETWDNTRYELDNNTDEIKETIEGTFRQFPLRLAWAITIHKSQGLTFSHALIDASRSFAHGQCYVALSRCKSLEGMVLDAPLSYSSVICDSRVSDFLRRKREECPDGDGLRAYISGYRLRLAVELFDFKPLSDAVSDARHVNEEAFVAVFPGLVDAWRRMEKEMAAALDVSVRFYHQYMPLMSSEGDESRLQQRFKAAASYFLEILKRLGELVKDTPTTVDSKTLSRQLESRINAVVEIASVKRELLRMCQTEDFTVQSYLTAKSKAVLAVDAGQRDKRRGESSKQMDRIAPRTTDRMVNPALYRLLTEWRRDKMKEIGKPAFTIMSTATLKAIADAAPLTEREFLAVKGFGRKRFESYGNELTALISE